MGNKEMKDLVLHYADGEHRVMRATGMSSFELQEKLLDMNIEKCKGCEVYMNSFMLADEDEDLDGLCHDCRPQGHTHE